MSEAPGYPTKGDYPPGPPQVAYPQGPPTDQPPPYGYPPPPQGQPGAYPPPGQPGAYPPPGQPGAYPPPGQPGAYPPQGPYPAQPGYPASGVTNTTVVVSQPVIGPRQGGIGRYTQSPALVVCQHCQATVTTTLDYETGLLTFAVAGGLCLVGCVFGCCLIPFCIDATKDIEHKCPNCHKLVGKFRHFS